MDRDNFDGIDGIDFYINVPDELDLDHPELYDEGELESKIIELTTAINGIAPSEEKLEIITNYILPVGANTDDYTIAEYQGERVCILKDFVEFLYDSEESVSSSSNTGLNVETSAEGQGINK